MIAETIPCQFEFASSWAKSKGKQVSRTGIRLAHTSLCGKCNIILTPNLIKEQQDMTTYIGINSQPVWFIIDLCYTSMGKSNTDQLYTHVQSKINTDY